LKDAQNKLADEEADNQKKETELTQLKADIAEMREKLNEHKEIIAQKDVDHQELKSQLHSKIEEEQDKENDTLKEKEDQIQRLEDEKKVLETKCQEQELLQQEIQEIQAKLLAAEHAARSREDQLEKVINEKREIERQLDQKLTDQSQLPSIPSLQNDQHPLSSKEKEDTISKLTTDMKTNQAKFYSEQTQLKISQDAHIKKLTTEHQAQIEILKQKINELQENLKDNDEKLAAEKAKKSGGSKYFQSEDTEGDAQSAQPLLEVNNKGRGRQNLVAEQPFCACCGWQCVVM